MLFSSPREDEGGNPAIALWRAVFPSENRMEAKALGGWSFLPKREWKRRRLEGGLSSEKRMETKALGGRSFLLKREWKRGRLEGGLFSYKENEIEYKENGIAGFFEWAAFSPMGAGAVFAWALGAKCPARAK